MQLEIIYVEIHLVWHRIVASMTSRLSVSVQDYGQSLKWPSIRDQYPRDIVKPSGTKSDVNSMRSVERNKCRHLNGDHARQMLVIVPFSSHNLRCMTHHYCSSECKHPLWQLTFTGAQYNRGAWFRLGSNRKTLLWSVILNSEFSCGDKFISKLTSPLWSNVIKTSANCWIFCQSSWMESHQEPIRWSLHLPYKRLELTLSPVGL